MSRLEVTTLPCRMVQIPFLDLEACVEKGMRVGGGDPVVITGEGDCTDVSIYARPQMAPVDKLQHVGSYELICRHGDVRACKAICDSLRPVPNSTATEQYPATRPVIMRSTQGGIAGRSMSAFIWSDGTVLFSGSGCPKLRGHRGKLAAATVEKLLAATLLPNPSSTVKESDGAADGWTDTLVVSDGHTTRRLDREHPARTLVDEALGDNPCGGFVGKPTGAVEGVYKQQSH